MKTQISFMRYKIEFFHSTLCHGYVMIETIEKQKLITFWRVKVFMNEHCIYEGISFISCVITQQMILRLHFYFHYSTLTIFIHFNSINMEFFCTRRKLTSRNSTLQMRYFESSMKYVKMELMFECIWIWKEEVSS